MNHFRTTFGILVLTITLSSSALAGNIGGLKTNAAGNIGGMRANATGNIGGMRATPTSGSNLEFSISNNIVTMIRLLVESASLY
jgi:hypothetical protein